MDVQKNLYNVLAIANVSRKDYVLIVFSVMCHKENVNETEVSANVHGDSEHDHCSKVSKINGEAAAIQHGSVIEAIRTESSIGTTDANELQSSSLYLNKEHNDDYQPSRRVPSKEIKETTNSNIKDDISESLSDSLLHSEFRNPGILNNHSKSEQSTPNSEER